MCFTQELPVPLTGRTDSLLALQALESGEKLFNENKPDSAAYFFERALDMASDSELSSLKARIYYNLGRISMLRGNWQFTLSYMLKSAAISLDRGDSLKTADIYRFIGESYAGWKVFSLARQYGAEEYRLLVNTDSKTDAGLRTARYSYLMSDYDSAAIWYQECYKLSAGPERSDKRVEALYGLAATGIAMGEMGVARTYLEELLELKTDLSDSQGIGDVYNSLGLMEFNSGNIEGAIDYYSRALDHYRLGGHNLESVYSNLAICYQNKADNRQTEQYFELALSEAQKSGNRREQARIEHLLAVLSQRKGDLYHADYYSIASINSSKSSGSPDILSKSYLTYSQILEEGNDFVRALEYYQLHLALKDSLEIEGRFREQALETERSRMEGLEQQVRLDIADDALRDLELRNLRIENEKRANALRLLETENELGVLELERLEQDVIIERERYGNAIKDKEIMMLEQQRLIQRRDSILQEAEAQRLLRDNQQLEYETELQQSELEKEQEKRRMMSLLAISAGLTLLLILYSLISARRKNRILASQKKTIEEKNTTITDSIEYASRIQTAVLPPPGFLTAWGMDSFIMFRPKDIVSGDFYWGVQSGEFMCFAAADCTGHGVPGAFMSMLGTAFLNEIINSRQFENAADILKQLRDEVITSLRQKGVEGEAQDGMDIALCLYNKKENILHFSGANNPLYHVSDSRIERIMGDKMPIGIHVSLEKQFTNTIIRPAKGDILYLFSDGYADQFGGTEGKKFKYKPFRDMLLEISGLPLEEQKQILEDSFDKWKGENEQVDDVLVIGIRL